MENLDDRTPEELYDFLDWLAEYRKQRGRERSPGAYQARHYCKIMRAKVRKELRRRKLPATRPGDGRCYGPGCGKWQKAGAK